ncbi:MAG TPA: transposase [Nevskiaceae bacterium]
MARRPRLSIPGYPHHVIQRGNNGQPVFKDDDDRARLLELWAEYSRQEHVAIHAYVLMDNHIHLLATPTTADGLSRLMQAVGRRYVQYYNRRHERSGTLWEGRFRSSVVQSDRYLLACMVYIDLNPVRAGMVAKPADYWWSSHRHYVGQVADRLVTPHPLYWALANTPFARDQAYVALVAAGLSSAQTAALSESAMHNRTTGDSAFIDELEKLTGRRVRPGAAGRPRKREGNGDPRGGSAPRSAQM